MHGTPFPTDVEREFLRALWAHGTATYAEVVAALDARGVRYASNAPSLYLRRMAERGLIVRAEGARGYVYAAHPRDELGAAIMEGL